MLEKKNVYSMVKQDGIIMGLFFAEWYIVFDDENSGNYK